ncbi:MAG: adenosylcobinamide-GDP ribazoletransferase, partial [Cetobacterium sp.]
TDKMGLLISYVTVTAILYGIAQYFMLPFISLFIVLNILIVCGFLFGKLMTKKIGGITGDTLGALLELSSVLSLVLMYVTL